jgi:hypothetical protein
VANRERRLRSLPGWGYGPEIRAEDIDYVQWKLDYAVGMRIALKRFIAALERDGTVLGRRGRDKLKELVTAAEEFQNYRGKEGE